LKFLKRADTGSVENSMKYVALHVKSDVLTAISTVDRCRMPPRAVRYEVIKVFGKKGKENGKEVQSLAR
jgi:hypothetical protein